MKKVYVVYNSCGQFQARFTSYARAVRWAVREGDGMERSNKKGGKHMNQPTTYALGLFHGGLIIGFVWIMFKSIGKK